MPSTASRALALSLFLGFLPVCCSSASRTFWVSSVMTEGGITFFSKRAVTMSCCCPLNTSDSDLWPNGETNPLEEVFCPLQCSNLLCPTAFSRSAAVVLKVSARRYSLRFLNHILLILKKRHSNL